MGVSLSVGLQHQNVPAGVENQSFAYPCPQFAVSAEVVRLLLYASHDVAVDSSYSGHQGDQGHSHQSGGVDVQSGSSGAHASSGGQSQLIGGVQSGQNVLVHH